MEVKTGEIVCLIGPNRAGKTTLLLTLSGILKTTEGRVLFEEQDVTNLDPHQIAKRGLGHVPQGRHIFPTLSVIDNLKMGAYSHRHSKSRIEGSLEQVRRLFPILRTRENQRAGTLSGGEQQMLSIGRALMGRPKLLMLDPRSLEEIFVKLREMNREGLTLLIVEQEMALTLPIAHRGYVLQNGRITREGNASDLLADRDVKALFKSSLP